MHQLIWWLLALLWLPVVSQEFYQQGRKVSLKPVETSRPLTMRSLDATQETITWYTTAEGLRLGTNQQVLITWEPKANRAAVLAAYPHLSTEELSPSITLVTFGPTVDIFAVALKLYDLPSVAAAHPNFTKEKVRR